MTESCAGDQGPLGRERKAVSPYSHFQRPWRSTQSVTQELVIWVFATCGYLLKRIKIRMQNKTLASLFPSQHYSQWPGSSKQPSIGEWKTKGVCSCNGLQA